MQYKKSYEKEKPATDLEEAAEKKMTSQKHVET